MAHAAPPAKGKHAADDHAAEAPVKKKRGMLFPIICVMAVMSGGVSPIAWNMLYPKAESSEAEEDHGEPHTELPKATESTFIPFGEVVANLSDVGVSRFIRIKLVLEVDVKDVEAVTASLSGNKAPLTNWMLGLLSDLTSDQAQGALNQNRIRRILRERFNLYLSPDGSEKVREVLFEEYNVQ